MPHAIVPSDTLVFDVCTSAHKVPDAAVDAMRMKGVQANIILPLLLKCRAGLEKDASNVWIVVYSCEERTEVLYVAALARTAVGEYPLFIFTTERPGEDDDALLSLDMDALARCLLDLVPLARVFSVFAPSRITRVFSEHWERVAGIEAYRKPYYDCTLSHATAASLKPLRAKVVQSGREMQYEICRGTVDDITDIAALCMMFFGG